MNFMKTVSVSLISVLCLTLASCGGGGGGSNTQTGEVINGISVPLEPDPTTNNATIMGVDSNGNGVRDDVERKIAKNYPEKFKQLIIYTSWVQKDLLNEPLNEQDRLIEIEVACGRTNLDPNNDIIEYLFADGLINDEYVKRLQLKTISDIDCGDDK